MSSDTSEPFLVEVVPHLFIGHVSQLQRTAKLADAGFRKYFLLLKPRIILLSTEGGPTDADGRLDIASFPIAEPAQLPSKLKKIRKEINNGRLIGGCLVMR